MKLTQSEVKQMQSDKACPCCGKSLTALEIKHLFGGGNGTNYFSDTWEWTGSGWTQVVTTSVTSPGSRSA